MAEMLKIQTIDIFKGGNFMAKVTTYIIKRIVGGREDIEKMISREYGVRTHNVTMNVYFNYSGEAEIGFHVPGYSEPVCFMTNKGQMKFIPKASYNLYYKKVEETVEEESDEQKQLKNLTEEVKKLREELKK